jgi:hypothetical protein
MRLILSLALAASLSACATSAPLDLCKSAELRRTVYLTAVTAADAFIASGRAVPRELLLGRQAAVTALALLDARCPAPRA